MMIIGEQENFRNRQKIRVIANFHAIGGGELSVINIIKMLLSSKYDIELIYTKSLNSKLKEKLSNEIKISSLNNVEIKLVDIIFIYANDFVYQLNKNKVKLLKLLESSKKNIVVLNFVIGEAWQNWFSEKIDKFIFLNNTKKREFELKIKQNHLKEKDCYVLAPPVFIDEYLDIRPNYSELNFVRTGRYGGKYEVKSYLSIIEAWQGITPNSHYWFMATPPFIRDKFGNNDKFHLYNWDDISVKNILSQGSLFHYHLPQKLREQGPRVIVEAMASGLPIITHKRDGMLDRVNEETGWFAENVDDFINVVKLIKQNKKLLKIKGENAKKRAKELFNPYKWINLITN